MNRRSFLLASAATATTGPLLLGMTRKAGTDTPTIGVDGHKYECHHNWGTLPTNLEWQTTHNVAVDHNGHVYVTHQGVKDKKGMDTTMVFDPAGQFVRSFGKEWHTGGHGIDFRTEGGEEFIYLTNTWASPKVVKTNLKGEVVWKKGRPECKEYEKRPDPKDAKKTVTPNYNPTNVAFCPDGSFFVGDGYGSHYMLKYDKDGNLLKVFGGYGAGEGQFKTPHGNWIDARDPAKPVLVVCDRANNRLQWFDLDGKFLKATKPNETVLFPAHIDTNKDVMMVADLHTQITLLDRENKPIVHLGEEPEWRKKVVGSLGAKAPERPVRTQPKLWEAGKFVHPHDACFDKDGNIYVAEWVDGGRITFLKKVG